MAVTYSFGDRVVSSEVLTAPNGAAMVSGLSIIHFFFGSLLTMIKIIVSNERTDIIGTGTKYKIIGRKI